MAALEKLVKALEALKLNTSTSTAEEPVVRCKQKVSLCVVVADMICSPETRAAQNFPYLLSYSMETLLQMCDDQDSNIRMIADECLNRIIRAMMDNNIVKVQVELHKEIKKNGSARSLRAALWRFAELAHMIKPQKGKPYVQNLVPCLINIAKRKEEPVLETLATAIPKIFSALGCFTTDNDIRSLLQVFLQNITSEQAVVRRTAATSILNICLHTPKTQFFLIHIINSLLDSVLPVRNDQSSYSILGILNCMRGILAHLNSEGKEIVLRGSFGVRRKQNKQANLSVDTMIQVYELCLHWTHHTDHNIVTASLETLNQLLMTPPPQLVSVLLCPQGLGRSRIHTPSTNRLSNRSLSEVSVASTLPLVDDSALLETEEDTPTTNLSQWLQDSGVLPNQPIPLTPGLTQQSTEEGDTESESLASEDVEPLLKQITAVPSPEPEVLGSRDSPSPPLSGQEVVQVQPWDIGEVTEVNQCALIYCARRLVTAFLIPDSGPPVRVSVRALALGSLSQVLRLYPQVFSATIDKNGLTTPQGFSHISDVLCFSTHSDQQLRGLTQLLISYLIHARLEHGWINSSNEFSSEKGNYMNKNVTLENLVDILLEGMSDESSVCVRHTLGALSICLSDLLENCYAFSIPILEKLLSLGNNPYWLVKVKLAELVCGLSYQCIYYITESSNYQCKVMNSVVLALLGDEDSRVRKAAAEGITRIVENLYYPVDYGQDDVTIARGTNMSRKLFADVFEIGKAGQSNGPLSRSCDSMIENTLSRLVQILSQNLLESSSKHLAYGCIEALSMLSDKFPTTSYPLGWQCYLENSEATQNSQTSASNGLLAIVSALLTASPLSLDLETHQWLLKLAGNLFAGLSLCHSTQGELSSDSSQIWSTISDKKLALIAENLLQHVTRLVFIFVKILEDIAHSRNIGGSPLKRRATRGTSPSKQTSTPEKEGIKEDKGRPYGYFAHIPHCVKLYDLIRSAYTNYRITLDSGASEKFLSLIHCVLNCLECLLSQAGVIETGRIAEEILMYLRIVFILDSTATVKVVNQLLKSLFEANFGGGYTPDLKQSTLNHKPPSCGFYNNIFHLPLQNLSYNLETYSKTPFDLGRGSGRGPCMDKPKIINRQYDREALAANIKLFEPIVIQALREYTITSNVRLQVQVLRLLTQLVQLKVNYCLLDSDQIFIQFVLKQFEYLEAGQIQHAELLIPQVFKFLVHLSNERNHSKPVISVPKVIMLCDGLMASGQNPVTHCIPALMPVVEHVFLLNSSSTSDIKELETQREVMLAMLLRLAEYPEVLAILYKMMREGWRWEEHWKRWYRQTIEAILPLLAEARLLLENCSILHGLLNLNSSFTSPIDNLLMLLFTPQQEGQETVHWLGMITTMMSSICLYKEEWIFLHLEQLNLYVKEEGDDPLNVNTVSKTLPPQSLMAKLILRVVKTTAMKLDYLKKNSYETEKFEGIEKLLANFMLCCIHITQPGNFDKVKKSLKNLIETDSEVEDINRTFINMAQKSPMLILLWAYLFMQLDQGHKEFWSRLMIKGRKPNKDFGSKLPVRSTSLNLEVVKRGSILLYCEYISKNPNNIDALKWLLEVGIEDLIWHCQEAPVEKFLCSIYNLEPNSKLLLEALSKCITNTQPVFTHRLLHTLEYIHSSYTGSVLRLVATSLIEHHNIAIARLASALCTRTLEYMLTLDSSAVLSQMSRDQLLLLLETLTSNPKQSKRHNGLISLLNKLGMQYFDISPCELEYGRSVNAAHIRSIVLDKSWVLSQVKDKCCNGAESNGRKCARLLSELESDDIATILNSPNFDINILQHCFTLGTQMTLDYCLKHPGSKPIENLTPLYICAKFTLLNLVKDITKYLPLPYHVYNPSSPVMSKRCKELDQVFSNPDFRQAFIPLVPAVSNYLYSIPNLLRDPASLKDLLPNDCCENLAHFGVLCMEMANWLMYVPSRSMNKNWPTTLQYLVESAAIIFQLDSITSRLSHMQISSICNTITSLVKMVTGEEITMKILKNSSEIAEDSQSLMTTCLQMASLISWLELQTESITDMPGHMYECIRSLVVSLGRNQKLNWFCRTPVEAWQIPLSVDCPPPLPLHLLHDADILHQIVFRISLLGWTGRLQFEETWVCLLGALSLNPDMDATDHEEISVIMQANSIAVDGITWLVLSTLASNPGNPKSSTLLHIPRHNNEKLYSLSCWKRLEEMTESLCWRLNKVDSNKRVELMRIDKRPNFERGNDRSGYSFGQLSVEYLQTQIIPPEERGSSETGVNAICAEKEKQLSNSGLDVRSCTHFLLDLFSQWTLPNSGISLNLQLSMVKSILSLSDMFNERSHYSWMLSTLLDMFKIHPQHDEVLHQYLVIGICKAAAVLNSFDGEVGEKILKCLEFALKSQFAPLRAAGIHGLLYLLQSIQNVTKSDLTADLSQKFGMQEFRQKVIQNTIDYLSKYVSMEECVEDTLLILALIMYFLECFPDEIQNTQAIMKFLTNLAKFPKNQNIYQAVMQGLERLILIGRTDLGEQITRLALDRFSQSDPCVTLPALQLLLACIYSDQWAKEAINQSDNTERTMEIMEKTTALFDRIKKGYPVEVEVVCEILPRILSDFFPASDILTKVIGEFLSPNQPHKRNMAAMVFQVFTQACSEKQLPLLQDWVVHSLSNFTSNLPVVMAVWSLCCFFISASANPWLKAIFPHVQSRIRQCDYEDRKILCIAAVDFYQQLGDKQKEIFLQSFKETSSNQKSPFADVIACL